MLISTIDILNELGSSIPTLLVIRYLDPFYLITNYYKTKKIRTEVKIKEEELKKLKLLK